MCRRQIASGDEPLQSCQRNLSAHLEEVCDRHDEYDDYDDPEDADGTDGGGEGDGSCDWDDAERQEQDWEGDGGEGDLEEGHKSSLEEARSHVARHTVARLLDNAVGVGGSL